MFKYKHMIKEEAKRKVKILTFWQKHGTEATKEAFGVGRSTLFEWQRILKENKGKIESLNNKSTKPKSINQRRVDYRAEQEIIRLRTKHYRLGKEKIAVFT